MLKYRKHVGQVVLVLLVTFGVFLAEVRAQRPFGGRPGGTMSGGMLSGGGIPGSRGPGGMMPSGMMPGGAQLPGGGRMPGGSASPSTSGFGGSAGRYGGYGDAPGAYGGGRTEMPTALHGSDTSQPSGLRGLDVILTASGVPNDGGQVRWPLGLRLLGSEEAEALRQQTEALFQVAAMQAQLGQSNPQLTRELTQAVNDLRGRLRVKNDRSPLPSAAYQEAERFLNRLKKAPAILEQALAAPAGGYDQLHTTTRSTQPPATATVPGS